MDGNIFKLIALAIVGGVAKNLFGPPRPPIHNHYDKPAQLNEPTPSPLFDSRDN